MSTEPLKKYIKGTEALKAGDRHQAVQLLAESMGADKPTSMMEHALEELADCNEAALTLVINECKRSDHGR